MTGQRHFIRGAALALLAMLATYSSVSFAQLSSEERQHNIDSFEHVWKTIHDQHFDPTFGGLDWQAVHDELRPKVDTATSLPTARAVMTDMLSRLRLSHFAIIPADVYKNIDAPVKKGDRGGSVGIDERVIDGRAIVTRVVPGGPASAAGVRTGWEIRSIDAEALPPLFPPIEKEFKDNPREDAYLVHAVRSRLSGAIGDSVTVLFMDGADKPIEKRIVLEEPKGKKVVFGNFPAFYLTFETDTLRDGVGYFAFNSFFDPMTLMSAFGNAMQSFMHAPGMIIDVRGNPGGIAGMGVGMAGWFIEGKNIDMGTMRTRDNTLKLVINPREPGYKGPVAILVDEMSGSSSEMFAGGVQGLPGVRVFGSRTMGATLPGIAERLPNGDGFQYAFASYISRNGVELEGKGVIPDAAAPLTRAALLEGRDPAIEAAVDWILKQDYNGK